MQRHCRGGILLLFPHPAAQRNAGGRPGNAAEVDLPGSPSSPRNAHPAQRRKSLLDRLQLYRPSAVLICQSNVWHLLRLACDAECPRGGRISGPVGQQPPACDRHPGNLPIGPQPLQNATHGNRDDRHPLGMCGYHGVTGDWDVSGRGASAWRTRLRLPGP